MDQEPLVKTFVIPQQNYRLTFLRNIPYQRENAWGCAQPHSYVSRNATSIFVCCEVRWPIFESQILHL